MKASESVKTSLPCIKHCVPALGGRHSFMVVVISSFLIVMRLPILHISCRSSRNTRKRRKLIAPSVQKNIEDSFASTPIAKRVNRVRHVLIAILIVQ
jgi:hypothetical protein